MRGAEQGRKSLRLGGACTLPRQPQPGAPRTSNLVRYQYPIRREQLGAIRAISGMTPPNGQERRFTTGERQGRRESARVSMRAP